MVVNKKIEKNNEIGDALEYISKGGEVVADRQKDLATEWKTICLRIPMDLLENVDGKVKVRAALTRTAWILEAIQEKLKGESNENKGRSQD